MQLVTDICIATVGALIGAVLVEMLIHHAWRADSTDIDSRLADADRRLSVTLPKLM